MEVEITQQEESITDMVIATGLDIEEEEEHYERHQALRRGPRKAAR